MCQNEHRHIKYVLYRIFQNTSYIYRRNAKITCTLCRHFFRMKFYVYHFSAAKCTTWVLYLVFCYCSKWQSKLSDSCCSTVTLKNLLGRREGPGLFLYMHFYYWCNLTLWNYLWSSLWTVLSRAGHHQVSPQDAACAWSCPTTVVNGLWHEIISFSFWGA
jgi:hypothetical protein